MVVKILIILLFLLLLLFLFLTSGDGGKMIMVEKVEVGGIRKVARCIYAHLRLCPCSELNGAG